jgi:formate dehydrogenase alpha subunit
MAQVNLQIDGRSVSVAEGKTILQACRSEGIEIPHLCYSDDLPANSTCRLCVVEVDGANNLVPSCSAQVTPNMVVSTNSERVAAARKLVLELLMSDHPADCLSGTNGSACELERYAREFGLATTRYLGETHDYEVDESSPFFTVDLNRCILCGLCVTACNDIQHIGAIDLAFRGFDAKVSTLFDRPLIDSICTSCGQCLSACPTDAITLKTPAENVVRSVTTTCPFCGVGCGMKAQIDENERIVEMLDDPDNPSSNGMLCVKGRFGYTYVHHEDRLTTPLVRKNGKLEPVGWDEALDFASEGLARYRGDSFGALCSAKTTNEDGFAQQKLARLLMQTNNVDHCARLCHAPSVTAMIAALGSGATSNSYVDYEEAGCLLIVGSDPTTNHPVIAARMKKAIVERGAKLIVINPRRIDMCDLADVWLRPNPGTDVALCNGMAKVILDEGLADKAFIDNRTEGFEEWLEVVDGYPPERTEELTGVAAADIVEAARIYARPPFSGSCLAWGMGITQHTQGTANAHSLVNLALVAGQIGKPGAGVSPLRGQNNVQGCGDAGCLPNLFPGYQALNDATMAKFSAAWSDQPLPSEPGLRLTQMVEQMPTGDIKAVYLVGENPLLSEPDLHHAEKAFESLEFLVVQDIFLHETAQLADVVLPATSFAEKDGTFSNSERRVQRIRKAVDAPGESRPDWQIISELGQRISQRLDLGLEHEFAYTHPSEIWDEMASLVPFLSGISYDRLDTEGGIQWPCTDEVHPGTRFLYEEGFPRGPRAKFVPFEQGERAKELPSAQYPLHLSTGRILYHWHGGTMTRRADTLVARSPELEVAINPEDGEQYSVADGERVRLVSRRGELEGRAVHTDRMRPGEVFVPFVKLGDQAANFLTNAVYDPDSGIPEYKVCAIRIERADESGATRRKQSE